MRTALTTVLEATQRSLAGGRDFGGRADLEVIESCTRTLLRHVEALAGRAAGEDEGGQAQEPRHCLAQELERRVEERTAMLRRLARELDATESRERRQIARDLHDDLGQTLAAMQMRLTCLCNDPREDVRQAGNGLVRLVDEAHRATRSLAAQLAPTVLYELGLEPALEWLATDLGRRFGLRIIVRDDGSEKPLSYEVRSIVYRAVGELLVNVVRHAKVDRAILAISRQGDTMCICVSDAGVGFDCPAQADPATGLGLFGIRERLAYVGGRIRIESIAGSGTEALLFVPLAAHA